MGENSNILHGEHFENFTLTAIYLKEKINSNGIILVQGSQKKSRDTVVDTSKINSRHTQNLSTPNTIVYGAMLSR